MSHTLDKRFGDLYIFGEYKDGFVDLVWSSHSGEFTIEHITNDQAEKLMHVWNQQREYMYKLYKLEATGGEHCEMEAEL